jgi:hypothetical protein
MLAYEHQRPTCGFIRRPINKLLLLLLLLLLIQ